MHPKEKMMRKAARLFNGMVGSKARGWVLGFENEDPIPNPRRREDVQRFETGWLEGQEARKEMKNE